MNRLFMLLVAMSVIMFVAAASAESPANCQGACAVKPEVKAAVPEPAATEPVPPVPAQGTNIGTEVLKTLLESRVTMVVLDARTGKYDDGVRIHGAKGLSPQAAVGDVLKVAPSRQMLVVTYCANLHCPASAALAKHLRELGYKNVLEYPFGIQGWKEAGLPVDQPTK